MSPDVTTLPPALVTWLVTAEHEPIADWAPEPPTGELRCDPDLVARLTQLARPIGNTRRRFVEGCPVIHHPLGSPIAVAQGSSWIAVHSDLPVGALEPSVRRVPPLREFGWVELDPWAPDTAFAKAIDLLRAHAVRAYELAEARP